MSASSSVDNGTPSVVKTQPNWRTITCEDSPKELALLMAQEEAWSEEQYQESLQLYQQLKSCSDNYVGHEIHNALCHLDNAFRLYGPQAVVCSYNGGKDACAILHLVRATAANYFASRPDTTPTRPRAIYFEHEDEFEQVLTLLQDTVKSCDLDMIAFEQSIKFSEGLTKLVDTQKSPLAFVLGTRSTDPNAGNQGHFAPSSDWMPPFMRINPVLDWSYGHIWHFLRLFKLPYCILYDRGYTSLGTTKDTLPCPALAVAGSTSDGSVPRYWPAFMLQDWDLERAGRIKKEKKPPAEPISVSSDKSRDTEALSSITALGAGDKTKKASPVETVVVAAPDSDVSANTLCESNLDSERERTVGLLIIGDEILKGMTADTNTQAAAKALRDMNVQLATVAVVSDCPDAIVSEIKRLKREVDVIITSGGVGPTHDDVTIKSVGVALEKDLILHEEMAKLLREKMNEDPNSQPPPKLTQAQVKMATLPSNAKLRYLSPHKDDWPTLQCGHIFILPGVPQFFAKKVESLAVYLSSQLERSATYKVVLSVDEPSIVPILNDVVEKHPLVSFGSYPYVAQPEFQTVVTLEGRIQEGKRNSSLDLYADVGDMGESRITKEAMDLNVKLALDDLVQQLENAENGLAGCVLRVENDDQLFS